MLNSLSGRFLILTTIFVMLAEVLIFVPSVARFREDYLLARLERAQIASLALLADDMLDAELERELLENAEVLNVVLRRDEIRQLALSSPIPSPISATFDLREATSLTLISHALARLANHEDQIIRVMGNPVQEGGLLIEITMETAPLRAAMIDYGLRVLVLSLVISVVTAGLLFLAVQRLIVRPIKGVVSTMQDYAEQPEDAHRIIIPSSRVTELREAEEALKSLQTDLTSLLRQKERLAQLGGAVAKVSHDLRNILSSAQLFVDRIETSEDPLVTRMAPKLVGSITRAVNLCEATLAFGRAEEPPPRLQWVRLSEIAIDVADSEQLASAEHEVEITVEMDPALEVRADGEQIHRILTNLVRNARQAIQASRKPGRIRITSDEDEEAWWIRITDSGPGLPKKALDHLFQPFQGGASRGGAGLGLAIAAELVRGHGGKLELLRSGEGGTEFAIRLPKTGISLEAAAE